ncbi:MAG: hypothetical protein SNG79_01355 [Rikenellaceae bacterium]
MRRIVISDESVNCYGTWIKTDGVDLSQYERNPVLLWMHQRGVIIGCIKDIRKEGDKITGEPFFDEAREESRIAKKQWEAGTLRMCSGKFIPTEVDDNVELVKDGQYRATIVKSELFEVSMVDIGGNNNALPIVLYSDGEELNLAAGDDNASLPLLNNNKQQKEKMEKKFTSAVALQMGLTDTATEADVLAHIELLNGYKTTNEKLEQEKEAMVLSSITSAVQTAITERRISADKKDHFIELGKKVGVESLKVTFESMSVTPKPMDLINQGGGNGAIALGYKKLSEVPADKIAEMRENDPTSYMALYKAEYGIECPKL